LRKSEISLNRTLGLIALKFDSGVYNFRVGKLVVFEISICYRLARQNLFGLRRSGENAEFASKK